MDTDASPYVTKERHRPGSVRLDDALDGAPAQQRTPLPIDHPPRVIERLAEISHDQALFARVVNALINRIHDYLVARLYSPAPPKGSRLLNLGCGDTLFDGWVNADRLRLAFLLYNIVKVARGALKLPQWITDAAAKWNCPENYWEGIYTEHVLEHMPYSDAVIALKEAFRTLLPGKWIRIVLPDLQRYIQFYNGNAPDPWFKEQFAYGAEAISSLTQNWGHVSVWDANLLSAILGEIGFSNIAVVGFGCGTDHRLIMDHPARRHESFYLEAQKPSAP